jgi:hypothetical protein
MTAKETLLAELQDFPEPLLSEVLDFVRFLKTKERRKTVETAMLSEPALARDWLRPEDDEAWRDL